MTWKFFLYNWGGLNAALFQVINQGNTGEPRTLSLVFQLRR